MKILIGMETSGEIRRAFAARGWHAVSVDLLPSDDVPSCGPWRTQQHWIGDVRDFIARDWDMFIFHPDCTYLTCSAEWAYKDVQTKKLKPGTLYGKKRRQARAEAIDFVLDLWDRSKHIPKRCMENPIGALSTAFRKPNQIIQPNQFGEDASKATCLWLDGLKPLQIDPKKYIEPRMVCKRCRRTFAYGLAGKGCPHCGAEGGSALPRWANQTDSGQNRLPPSAERWRLRAKTYPGIANAMALQWGAGQGLRTGGTIDE